MKINRNTYSLALVCLIAEPFFLQINNFVLFIESKLLGVKCIFTLFSYGTLCKVGNSLTGTLIVHDLTTYNAFGFTLLGYYLTKVGCKQEHYGKQLLGTLFYFYALYQTCYFILMHFQHHLFLYVFFEEHPNLTYTISYYQFYISNSIFTLVYAYMAYRIIFKLWTKEYRIVVFSIGAVCAVLGMYLWHWGLARLLHGIHWFTYYS